jgi:alpha-D-xyloside xylohydrolase
MLGGSLLVAPVFSHDGEVSYYVPAGFWTNFISGEVVEGPGWEREIHGYMSLPLLVRPNTVIPVGNIDDRPDYDYEDRVTLQIYQFTDGIRKSISIPNQTGKSGVIFEVEQQNSEIKITRVGDEKLWRVWLVGIDSVASVDGGRAKSGNQGTMVIPTDSVLKIKLGSAKDDDELP